MGKRIYRVDVLKEHHIRLEFKNSEVFDGGKVIDHLIKDTVKEPCHPDLLKSFSRLVPHLMFICKFNSPEPNESVWNLADIGEDYRFEDVSVTGIVTVGKEEINGVKIIGRITHENGDVVNIVSPIAYFERKGDYGYELANLLQDHIDDALTEVEKFYWKHKYETSQHLSLLEN